jgi:hypothetical protein
MNRRVCIVLLLVAGCGSSGPSSTQTSSTPAQTLAEKIAFLERYATFRRTYEALDYRVDYRNGGGMGPTEWDIRLVAKVPASQLSAWIPSGAKPSHPDQDWLKSVPNSGDLTGFTEWYTEAGRTIGIDRKQNLVAYRSQKF